MVNSSDAFLIEVRISDSLLLHPYADYTHHEYWPM